VSRGGDGRLELNGGAEGGGKLDRRTDERALAHEHLITATTMDREMGMTYWLEQAETSMAESG
jgi:hypothetical protein